MPLGKHIILDIWDYDESKDLEETLINAAEKAGLKVVGKVKNKFEPHGESIVILIAESHLSIHTWPEEKFAAIDIFSCSSPDTAYLATMEMLASLKPQHYKVKILDRG